MQPARDISGDAVVAPTEIVRPRTTEEVQALVRRGRPLYVVSRGKNWGYGERATLQPGALLVDLSEMNRIVEVDEKLGYVVLEPGVSQGQLAERLAGTKLWMDCSGAGPDASVVGNLLERGFGHTPYGDRFEQCAAMEVVLGTGEIVRTGFLGYAGAAAAHTYGHGVGPNLKGLFTQSNMGIVTRVTLWLMPKPEAFEAFFLRLEGDVGPAIEELSRLQLEGTLRSKIHIANDLRLASNRGPRATATALSPQARAELKAKNGSGAWNITGGLYGSREMVAAAKRTLKRSAIRGSWLFVNAQNEKLIGFFARLTGKAAAWHGATTSLALLRGQPTAAALAATQWAVAAPDIAAKDPAATNAGLAWIAPVVPARADAVRDAISLTERILAEHGFDPLITLTMINPRSLCLILQLAFDKTTHSARACHDALLTAYLDGGLVPYRSHPWGFAELRRRSPQFWQAAADIKRALDPAGIISPERYLP